MAGPDDAFVYSSPFVLAAVIVVAILILFSTFATPNRIFEGAFLKIFWLVIPLVAYLLSVGISFAGQYFLCKNTNVARAFTTSLSALGILYAFLFVPYQFPVARMPVGSIFVSKFTRVPNPDFYQVEAANPTLMGISFAYYAFWGVLFGQIVSSSLSAAC